MGRERFDSERFGRVMASEKKIETKFLGCDRGPVWRFTRDKRVDLFLRNAINFRAGPARYDPNVARSFRAKQE